MGPGSSEAVLVRAHGVTLSKGDVSVHAEGGVMCLRDRECARRGQEMVSPSEPLGGTNLADTLFLDFWSPEL